MFYLPKSRSAPDLEDKEIVQFKVLIDWLRSIHRQNTNILTRLRQLEEQISDQSSSPSGEPVLDE